MAEDNAGVFYWIIVIIDCNLYLQGVHMCVGHRPGVANPKCSFIEVSMPGLKCVSDLSSR